MELIPILSLIVLVATISTFILAVGAYILYKIRERKGRTSEAPQPSSIPAELVAPSPVIAEQHTTGTRRTYDEPYPTRERTSEYQRSPQQQRAQSGPEMRPTYVSSPPPPTRATSSYSGGTKYTSSDDSRYSTSERKKFMRYTREGYVEPTKEQEKKKKEDKLKWR